MDGRSCWVNNKMAEWAARQLEYVQVCLLVFEQGEKIECGSDEWFNRYKTPATRIQVMAVRCLMKRFRT